MCAVSVDGPDNNEPEERGPDWSFWAIWVILGLFSAGAVVMIALAVL